MRLLAKTPPRGIAADAYQRPCSCPATYGKPTMQHSQSWNAPAQINLGRWVWPRRSGWTGLAELSACPQPSTILVRPTTTSRVLCRTSLAGTANARAYATSG